MFIVIFIAVLLLIHVYLWKRLVKDTTRLGRTRWILTAVLAALAVLLFAALILPRVIGITDSGWFAWPGHFWLGLAVYIILTLLVLEPFWLALRGWVRRAPSSATAASSTETVTTEVGSDDERAARLAMSRRLFLARTGAVAAGAASVGVVAVGAVNALGPPEMLHVPVHLRRLDPAFNGFRIAVVSDIHLGPLTGRAHTERIVRMINETAPDLVAIVGDLVDGTVEELGSAAEPLRDLVSRDGTFFVTGNHEYIVRDPSSWLRELERLGVQPLRNENTVIRRGAAAFDLAGVNDVSGDEVSDLRTSTEPCSVGIRRGRRSCLPTNRSWCRKQQRMGWTCNCPGTRTEAKRGLFTTSFGSRSLPSPDYRLWTAHSCMSRGARGSGVRPCDSARHRISRCFHCRQHCSSPFQ